MKNNRWLQRIIIVLALACPVPGHADTAINYVYDKMNRLIRVEDPVNAKVLEYQYDAVGNRTVKRVTVVPIDSMASTPGGTYYSSVSISLTCSANCDKIYYTTDGSTPTLTSNIYSDPISISQSTVLKYFPRDLAGNNGTVKTEVYDILNPCVPGFAFNTSSGICEAPVACPNGGTHNVTEGRCEKPTTKSCPTPGCPTFLETYDPSLQCYVCGGEECCVPSTTHYEISRDRCERGLSVCYQHWPHPHTPVPCCPHDFQMDSGNQVCFRSTSLSRICAEQTCPSDYPILVGGNTSNPLCITTDVCPQGGMLVQGQDKCQQSYVNVKNVDSGRIYSNLQTAYDEVVSGQTLRYQGVRTTDNLLANRDVSVTLDGGFDENFVTKIGVTSIAGSIQTAAGGGTLMIKDFILGVPQRKVVPKTPGFTGIVAVGSTVDFTVEGEEGEQNFFWSVNTGNNGSAQIVGTSMGISVTIQALSSGYSFSVRATDLKSGSVFSSDIVNIVSSQAAIVSTEQADDGIYSPSEVSLFTVDGSVSDLSATSDYTWSIVNQQPLTPGQTVARIVGSVTGHNVVMESLQEGTFQLRAVPVNGGSTLLSGVFTVTLPPVKIQESGDMFLNIQNAYDAASDGATITILCKAITMEGDIHINRNVTVSIIGGYNSDFTSQIGSTTVLGEICTEAGSGTITVSNLILASPP